MEGDYDGPTLEGMPDFHTYTMWYTNHGEPIGRLMRGYLPPVKAGWMIGCGEYGAEGLDPVDLMRRRYPKEWLQCDEKGDWYPDRIVRAQTHSVQGDWYPEQHMIGRLGQRKSEASGKCDKTDDRRLSKKRGCDQPDSHSSADRCMAVWLDENADRL